MNPYLLKNFVRYYLVQVQLKIIMKRHAISYIKHKLDFTN